jgi:integrase/recombinase XerD
MSDLAPVLQGFFTDRMITQKHASEHTIRSYRDTWRLLLAFAQDTTGTPPWKLDIGQLDAGLITAFLGSVTGRLTGRADQPDPYHD